MLEPAQDDRVRVRRVLMVLYHFPPIGGISMARNVRNVEYLPEHGWCPVVLTPGPADSGVEDPGSVLLIPPGTAIVRTGYFEVGDLQPLVRVARRASGFVRGGGRGAPPPASVAEDPASLSAPASTAGQTGLTTLVGAHDGLPGLAAVRRLLFFPDNQAGWIPFALIAALRAHRREPFEAAYSTFPPMTSHVVAAAFRRMTGVPWVAEFRDPWIGNGVESAPAWVIRQLRRKLERWVVRSADRVIAVTPRLAAMLERRYPGLTVELVSNGYVRGEALPASSSAAPDATFRIVYTGTLDRPPELEVFLAGLERAVARRPALRDQLRIDIFGNVAPACRGLIETADPAETVIALRGFVPRTEALAALAAADAALVLLGDGPGMDLFIPGKLFDYIGADRQVLAVLTDGDARDLLTRLDWGVVCRPDPDDVADAIERLVDQPHVERRADPTGAYERRTLAGRVAAVLDDAAGTGGGPRS